MTNLIAIQKFSICDSHRNVLQIRKTERVRRIEDRNEAF